MSSISKLLGLMSAKKFSVRVKLAFKALFSVLIWLKFHLLTPPYFNANTVYSLDTDDYFLKKRLPDIEYISVTRWLPVPQVENPMRPAPHVENPL